MSSRMTDFADAAMFEYLSQFGTERFEWMASELPLPRCLSFGLRKLSTSQEFSCT